MKYTEVFKKTQEQRDKVKAAKLQHKHSLNVHREELKKFQTDALNIILNRKTDIHWGSIDLRIVSY